MGAGGGDSIERFVETARAVVAAEAARNAEDRWWVLAPTIVAQRRDLTLELVEITPRLRTRPLGRALIAGQVRDALDALGARRCAIAMHVDLQEDDDIYSAIVLAVLAATASFFQFARVERTAAGMPRLGEWQPSPLGEEEIFAAVGRALAQ